MDKTLDDKMLYNTSPYYNKQNWQMLDSSSSSTNYNAMKEATNIITWLKKKGEGGRIQPTPPQVSLEASGGVAASNV